MFTGIVEALGTVERIDRRGATARLVVRSDEVASDGQKGDSVALNGCCLTIVAFAEGILEFDAGEETLRRTNLGALRRGDPINLERALLANARLGGHFVSGHIDCTARVRQRSDNADWSTIWFELPARWTCQMAPKGSVTVDGVSLTLVDVENDAFSVALIPHTLQVTTLGNRRVGDTVNIETDILAKYIQQIIQRRESEEV